MRALARVISAGIVPALFPKTPKVFCMNIHEYQAKEVLRGFGTAVPRGKPAFTANEAVAT